MGAYSVFDLGRRQVLLMSAVLASVGTAKLMSAASAETRLQRTPGQILGPFYPLTEMPETGDLTRVPGRPGRAEGQVLNVMGRVFSWRTGHQCKAGSLAGQRPRTLYASKRSEPGPARPELRWFCDPPHGCRRKISVQNDKTSRVSCWS